MPLQVVDLPKNNIPHNFLAKQGKFPTISPLDEVNPHNLPAKWGKLLVIL